MKNSIKNTLKALLIVMPFLFSGCSSRGKLVSNMDEKKVVIQLQKTECYGTCPTYKFFVFNNGTCEIRPKQHSIVGLDSRSRLTKKEFKAIMKRAEEIKFQSLKEEYDNPNISDLPSSLLTITSENWSKKIKIRTGAPKELRELLKMVENIVESRDWTPIEIPDF